MKVIFLDFDGVLNSDRYFAERDKLTTPETAGAYAVQPIDPMAVARVQRIVDATGAKIVVSSSWRFGSTARDMQNLLYDRGLRADVIDVTPTVFGAKRGREIDAWLRRASGITAWIAIDDESKVEMHPCGDRHVQTGWAEGLTDAIADEAIRLLGGSS